MNAVAYRLSDNAGFFDGYDLAKRIKKQAPHITIVFGGVHISSMGGTLLERFGAIGFFVIGEGEVTLTELANDNDVSRIDELVWREGCSDSY